MALRRPGPRAASTRLLADHPGDHAGQSRAQRRAVRARGRARPAAGLDDAVEHRVDELRGQDPLRAENHRGVAAFRARRGRGGLRFGDILGRLAVPGRCVEVVEDAWRADDRCLLGMRERNLDDLDAE